MRYLCGNLDLGNKCPACPQLSSVQEGKSSIGNTYERYLLYFMFVEDGHCYKSVFAMDAVFGLPRKKVCWY